MSRIKTIFVLMAIGILAWGLYPSEAQTLAELKSRRDVETSDSINGRYEIAVAIKASEPTILFDTRTGATWELITAKDSSHKWRYIELDKSKE